MSSIKINCIAAVGNVGRDPYIEILDEAGAGHRIIFEAKQTSTIITAIAMAGNQMIKRIAKTMPGKTLVPVSLPCRDVTAGGSKSKPDVFSLHLSLDQGPELSFELPTDQIEHLILALKGTAATLDKSAKQRLN